MSVTVVLQVKVEWRERLEAEVQKAVLQERASCQNFEENAVATAVQRAREQWREEEGAAVRRAREEWREEESVALRRAREEWREEQAMAVQRAREQWREEQAAAVQRAREEWREEQAKENQEKVERALSIARQQWQSR